MKGIRPLLICLLVLVLLPLGGLASSKNEYPGDGLYPVRIDGKWGYMDRQGAIVLTPRWAYAGPFENGYAAISEGAGRDGIIDRSGAYAIDPADGYVVEYEEGSASDIYDIRKETGADELCGFFDTLSGCFAKPQWTEVFSAFTADNRVMVWNDTLLGYADQRTGELVIPCAYGALEESWFQEGFALADAAGNDSPMDGSTYCLIDTSGKRLSLPEGILPVSGFHEGLAAVEAQDIQENTKYGFVDLSGKVVIPPQFDNYAWYGGFQEGYCAVAMGDKWGHIDRTGAWVCPPRFEAPEGYAFVNGIAVIWWDECTTTVVIDTQGNVLYEKPYQECHRIYDYTENGLAFYEFWDKDAQKTYDGLLDKSGNPVLDARLGYQLEDPYDAFFSEGLQCMSLNGRYGFINETGSVALPFVWDDAWDFKDGLAYVEKDGKMAYIDHAGSIVWQEP